VHKTPARLAFIYARYSRTKKGCILPEVFRNALDPTGRDFNFRFQLAEVAVSRQMFQNLDADRLTGGHRRHPRNREMGSNTTGGDGGGAT
jgi:hypothetical protein